MATPQSLNSEEIAQDHSVNSHLASLSLSSRTVHADDYLNVGQDVAPALHVSTTFRYDRNPDNLLPWTERDVCLILSFSHSNLIISYTFLLQQLTTNYHK